MPLSYPLGAAGVTTRVIEAGEGDRPVVFLHGVGARADRWQRTLPAFAKAGFHCYAIDFPGHGFATKGHGPDYGTPGFAHFVAGVLDALGLEHPALVGTSLGGTRRSLSDAVSSAPRVGTGAGRRRGTGADWARCRGGHPA